MLIPISDGTAYRVSSPATSSLVRPALAAELRRVLEGFALGAGFDERRPVEIFFAPGVVGHHREGRAADIYGVGGRSVELWARWWFEPGCATPRPAGRNLGRDLYVAMARDGRWARPAGYPVQLFGPWTREVGPHVGVSDRVLAAHRDHIHAAV